AADLVLRHDGTVKVYEILGALPRAFVVHKIRRTLNDSSALAILRTEGAFDPRTEAIWIGEDRPPPVSEPVEPDSVRTLRYDFNTVEYMVRTAAPGLLLTVEQYDPDWTVTIDGTKAEIHRVNYLMRGVALPAGVHRVKFVYEPRALQAGIRISVASAAVTLLLGLAGFLLALRRRRAGAVPTSVPGNEAP
ncbi:MAG TPA: YfhO family protein, partial [Candidatus Eisenbacteria bacterium]|nr:YfhO family protein [Candidatus Eisenbacteria bacterium]